MCSVNELTRIISFHKTEVSSILEFFMVGLRHTSEQQ